MRHYNLGFISDEDIYEHVKNTVLQYRRSINLNDEFRVFTEDLHENAE